MTTSSTPVRIVEKTPAYWRVLFDNPPLNVVDGSVFERLQELLSRMDTSPDLVSLSSRARILSSTSLTLT